MTQRTDSFLKWTIFGGLLLISVIALSAIIRHTVAGAFALQDIFLFIVAVGSFGEAMYLRTVEE